MMTDRNASAAPVRLADYRPPAFLVDHVALTFELDPAETVVRTRLVLRRNPAAEADAPLRLDGEALTLRDLHLDGAPCAHRLEPGALVIEAAPAACTLDIVTHISPERNTELSGLYVSGGSFFTQCEAEGFRRITYFPDRPDVMARYSVTLIADRARCPVLLSNGNPVASGTHEDGRHFATWDDPHPKPCYLFALVAGDLVAVRDEFVTASGRTVALAIWVRRGDEDRCGHAMHCLKQAMRWDEEAFGREYDLDVFNIAAVSDFNMGAMENKGLNIFNTRYVLARPETATDIDYQGIETVVSHEYFHNWTGNRITCRDWFQLSLKEGLTVYRDQEFSAAMGSAAVKRIADIRRLRAAQFPEDAGPLAHPVRPASYLKIDNFYTATVYQKGAEVVRMIATLLGRERFRRGMDLYFARHDNQAVTIEAFVAAMQDASGVDLRQFMLWYSQAGTPEISADERYDAIARRYSLTLRQATPPTPGQEEKAPFMIPVAMALLGPDGTELPLRLAGENAATRGERVLVLDKAEQVFVFEDVAVAPTASLLRGFSAPVKLAGRGRDQLRRLAAQETDPFQRWDAVQTYAMAVLLDLVADHRAGRVLALDDGLVEAFAATLAGAERDPAFAAEALALPGESLLADQMAVVDVDGIHAAREFVRAGLGRALAPRLRAAYAGFAETGPYRNDGAAIGRRALKNTALAYLVAAGEGEDGEGEALARAQFEAGRNMTDVLAALALLAGRAGAARTAALDAFHRAWRGDDLVLDKWFAIQAMACRAGVPVDDQVAEIRALAAHPDFDLHNPNRVRAVIGSFAMGNPACFHAPSGAGYRFVTDRLRALDAINPQVAARLVPAFGAWRRYDPPRAAAMRAALADLRATAGLSRNSFEMADRSLGAES